MLRGGASHKLSVLMDKLLDADMELATFPEELAGLYKTPLLRRLEAVMGEDAAFLNISVEGTKVRIHTDEENDWVMEKWNTQIDEVQAEWAEDVVKNLTARILARMG